MEPLENSISHYMYILQLYKYHQRTNLSIARVAHAANFQDQAVNEGHRWFNAGRGILNIL